MRVLFTWQTGLDKKAHLQSLREYCARRGRSIDEVYHVGDMMYEESKKSGFALKEGKILDLPLAHLGALRRAAFNLIPKEPADGQHAFINSHVVFRWDNRLFRAFELEEVQGHPARLHHQPHRRRGRRQGRVWTGLKESDKLPSDTRYSLKDLLVWREEEMLASEILASVLEIPHYVLGVSLEDAGVRLSPGGGLQPHVRAVEEEGLHQFPHQAGAGQAGDLGQGHPLSGGSRAPTSPPLTR